MHGHLDQRDARCSSDLTVLFVPVRPPPQSLLKKKRRQKLVSVVLASSTVAPVTRQIIPSPRERPTHGSVFPGERRPATITANFAQKKEKKRMGVQPYSQLVVISYLVRDNSRRSSKKGGYVQDGGGGRIRAAQWVSEA